MYAPNRSIDSTLSRTPHLTQELRFIFPALPLFNLAAGVGMSRAVLVVRAADKQKEEDDIGKGNGNGGGDERGDDGQGVGARTRSKARWAPEARLP